MARFTELRIPHTKCVFTSYIYMRSATYIFLGNNRPAAGFCLELRWSVNGSACIGQQRRTDFGYYPYNRIDRAIGIQQYCFGCCGVVYGRPQFRWPMLMRTYWMTLTASVWHFFSTYSLLIGLVDAIGKMSFILYPNEVEFDRIGQWFWFWCEWEHK